MFLTIALTFQARDESGKHVATKSVFHSLAHVRISLEYAKLMVKLGELGIHFWVRKTALLAEGVDIVFLQQIKEKFFVHLFKQRSRTASVQIL